MQFRYTFHFAIYAQNVQIYLRAGPCIYTPIERASEAEDRICVLTRARIMLWAFDCVYYSRSQYIGLQIMRAINALWGVKGIF